MDADKDVCSACGQSFNCSYPLESSEARRWVLQALGVVHQPDTYVTRVTLWKCHSCSSITYHVLSSSSLKFVSNSHKILSTLLKKKFVGCFCKFIENKEQKYAQGCAALPLHTSSMHHVGWDVPTTWMASMRKFRRLTCLQKVWSLTLHVGTQTDHELCVELTLERRTFTFCSSPPIRRWRWSSQREATPKQSA